MTHEKFILLEESLKALGKDIFNLLILKGEPGIGKTYRIINYLKDNKIDYEYVNAYTTPLKFFEILFKNRNKKIIVFDDVQSIDNPLIVNFLKSACWGVLDNQRELSYFSSNSYLEKNDLPESFNFNANIILIFNHDIKDYAPIINRGVQIGFDFTFKEKLEIFKELQSVANLDSEVLEYISTFGGVSTSNLSIRTLVILSELKRKGFDFKLFAKEMLKNDDELNLLIDLVSKSQGITEACDSWISRTGRSRATFFRLKKRLNI